MTAHITNSPDTAQIYFSDFFGISPERLEQYGAFDVALINDLPLFIDPFLLFNSNKPEYRELHDSIIRYVGFLRDKSVAGAINDSLLKAWFTFREIKENWLGYSLRGNKGSGLGMDFAQALNTNLAQIFTNFGGEEVTEGSHIEKVCLVADGVGRDNISDFATNLIQGYLLEYTQTFGRQFLQPDQLRRVAVRKAAFNYATESWETRIYELPFVSGAHVILTPIDILTKDEVWINKPDMVRDYTAIAAAIPNDQLRAELNNCFGRALQSVQRRDAERKRQSASTTRRRRSRAPTGPSQRQRDEAAQEVIRAFPVFIDWYIRWKELHGDQAEQQADAHVRSSERLYIAQVRDLVRTLAATRFYSVPGNTYDEAHARVKYLKNVIENQGGWRSFWVDGEPVRREADLRIMFRLTWFGTPSDVNQEVNNDRGPSDFEISRGSADKTTVEYKLASNTGLEKNLRAQTKIYQKASGSQHVITVIMFFTREERIRVQGILEGVGRRQDQDVILIDGRDDNKVSASKATSAELED